MGRQLQRVARRPACAVQVRRPECGRRCQWIRRGSDALVAATWVDVIGLVVPAADAAPPREWGLGINADLQHLYERTEKVIARTTLLATASSISSGTLAT